MTPSVFMACNSMAFLFVRDRTEEERNKQKYRGAGKKGNTEERRKLKGAKVRKCNGMRAEERWREVRRRRQRVLTRSSGVTVQLWHLRWRKTSAHFRIKSIFVQLVTQLTALHSYVSVCVCVCQNLCVCKHVHMWSGMCTLLTALLSQYAVIGCFNEQMSAEILGWS